MFKIKLSIFTVAFLILISCGTSVDSEKDKQTPVDISHLPKNVKSGDTVFITGLVYEIFGNEKTRGCPTILTAVRTR